MGRPRRVRPPELADESAVQEAAHDMARVDAADALDRPARHRLAVGDDGQRLQRRRREPHGVRAEVSGDEWPALGRCAEHDLLAGGDEPDAGSRSSTSRSPRRASTSSAPRPVRLRSSARVRGRSATKRSASRSATVAPRPPSPVPAGPSMVTAAISRSSPGSSSGPGPTGTRRVSLTAPSACGRRWDRRARPARRSPRGPSRARGARGT